MTNEARSKLIGVAMMLPLVIYSLYLILSGRLLMIVVPLLICGVLAHYGLKLVKGKSVTDITNDAINRASRIDKDSTSIGSRVR